MSLHRHIDWVIKRNLIGSTDLNDIEAQKINLLYHLIGEDGLYYSLRNENELERIVSIEEIEKALNVPPQDTRAAGRISLLEKLKRKGAILELVSWDKIVLRDGNKRKIISLDNPYRTYTDIVVE